jgi:hypothetical protein
VTILIPADIIHCSSGWNFGIRGGLEQGRMRLLNRHGRQAITAIEIELTRPGAALAAREKSRHAAH